MEYRNDTITAIATPAGKGSVAIIRISGDNAIKIADKIFAGQKPLKEKAAHTLSYGKIIDPATRKEVDQVLVSIFRKPKSFTGEDMVEINSHGGTVFPNKILNLLIQQGCRLAQKGEFSKRAFLNGKIDLTQAEAINDMISISTFAGSELALSNLNQSLSKELFLIKENLIFVLGLLQVRIDNPEEEIQDLSPDDFKKVAEALSKTQKIMKEGERGRKIAVGFRVVLTGKTNAGKSSVLNYLAGEEKAIVSQIHGTTRDVIETELNLNGYPVILIDTAGIREEVENEIEGYGIIKAKEEIKKADLILYILDGSEGLTEEDLTLIGKLRKDQFLIGINKQDLKEMNASILEQHGLTDFISFSSKTGKNMEELTQKITAKLGLKTIEDSHFYINQRQNEILLKFQEKLFQVHQMLTQKESEELIAFELSACLEILGEILGYSLNEDLMDTIFNNFCLGK